MIIERGDFVNLRLRKTCHFRQRANMCRRQASIGVLNPMQHFDQQIAAQFLPFKQAANLDERRVFQRPSLGTAVPPFYRDMLIHPCILLQLQAHRLD